ncbi:hypothetical protein CHS0354_005427 [Potamilus streckersoni]|uniref:Uncharacterized protein n=1 Tax=Potamilus streckersoni TaxID=2493646 RepID=A0AAE0WDU3_9BIVA|nr:hypothetical protein CHS0354_005427 [Potamilus streckersoni]
MPFQAGEKIRAGSGQEVPCQAEKTNTNAGEKKMDQSTEMPFQVGEKIRADPGQEVPSLTEKTDTMGKFSPTSGGDKLFLLDVQNYSKLPVSTGLEDGKLFLNGISSGGQEEDGPEYLNALSSGREDKGRLWSGSPLSSREDE